MSTGVVLAWATEAMQTGLISRAETDGLTLSKGDGTVYVEAARRIVGPPTDFFRALA